MCTSHRGVVDWYFTVILTTLNNTRQCFYQSKTIDSFWPVNVRKGWQGLTFNAIDIPWEVCQHFDPCSRRRVNVGNLQCTVYPLTRISDALTSRENRSHSALCGTSKGISYTECSDHNQFFSIFPISGTCIPLLYPAGSCYCQQVTTKNICLSIISSHCTPWPPPPVLVILQTSINRPKVIYWSLYFSFFNWGIRREIKGRSEVDITILWKGGCGWGTWDKNEGWRALYDVQYVIQILNYFAGNETKDSPRVPFVHACTCTSCWVLVSLKISVKRRQWYNVQFYIHVHVRGKSRPNY